MATIAEKVLDIVTSTDIAACTITYGYLVEHSGKRITFPPARIDRERRNDDGRVTYLLVRYADDSRLEFRYHPNRGASYRIPSVKREG